jgi:porin
MLRVSAAAVGALIAAPAAAEERPGGLDVGGSYVADSFATLSGGLERGFRQMGLLELTAELDGADVGLKGAQAFANVQLVHGESLSGDLVGDAQVLSNIDAPDGLRLFEAWLSVPVAGSGYVKGGLIDLNGEFDVQSVGALFLNSSHGIGPDFSQSGLNGPSIFPTSATAVVAGWDGGGWSVRAGLFNAVAGDPDRPRRTVVRLPGASGMLLVAEADFKIAEDAEVQVGAWRYTSKFELISAQEAPARRRGNGGVYAMVEGKITEVAGQRLDGWVRAGTAEMKFNPIGLYIGGGLALGPESSRWGIAVGHARLGRPARRAGGPGADRAETVIEFTYARAIGSRLIVQPDVQYVINPGWDSKLRDALVAGVRLQIALF